MSLLSVQGVTVTARLPGGPVAVLRALDLELEAGKVLGLVGESGAGKSMIGRLVAQALPPGFAATSGRVSFDGRDMLALTPAARRALLGREIAFIPQEPMSALNPVLTIGTQMDEHFRRLGVTSRVERRDMIRAALESVHLPNAADLPGRYPHQLSGGMCQRVLIAMAFAGRPKLVIADEPVTALDVTIQARIVDLMNELRARDGTALLFITHDLRLAARVSDEIAVLYAGAVVEQGPANAVFASPLHPYTRCLELANPAMTGPRRTLYTLPEQMPGLRAMAALPGCRFAPRCPIGMGACRASDPPLTGDTRRAACIRREQTPSITVTEEAADPVATGDPVLTVEGLVKHFHTGGLFRRRTVAAVAGVSFGVAEGEFVAIVGESGSGKSTLGRLIMGLERPDGGRIHLAGRDVTNPAGAARVHRVRTAQMVLQDPSSALNPRRRIASIVTQALEAAGLDAATRARRADEILEDMGVARELASRTPSQISGGQRQRVNIGRALCVVPKLLVADEIVSGLDVSIQAQLLTLLRRLRREHRFAMLFISHDLSVVRNLCDRVLVMYRGEIVEQGPVDDIFASPRHDYTKTLLSAAA
jgi:peptide/nickel transport system ATP-binding protein